MSPLRLLTPAVVLASVAGQVLVALQGPAWFGLQVGALAIPPAAYAVRRTWQDPLPPRLGTSDVAGFLNEGRWRRIPAVVWVPMLLETALVYPVLRLRSADFWFGPGAPDAGIFVLFQVLAILGLGLALYVGLALSMAVVFPVVALVRLARDPGPLLERRDVPTLLLFPVAGGMLAFLLTAVIAGLGSYAGKGSSLAALLFMGIALVSPGYPTAVPWALWVGRALAVTTLGLLLWRWRAARGSAPSGAAG